MQVDIERVEVDAHRVEVLGGREAREGDERLRVLRSCDVDELVDEPLDPLAPEPTHDVGRHLVDDAECEEGGVVLARPGGLTHGPSSTLLVFPTLEEAPVLRPGNVDEHLEAEGLGGVEHVSRRDVVDADRVGAEACGSVGSRLRAGPGREAGRPSPRGA